MSQQNGNQNNQNKQLSWSSGHTSAPAQPAQTQQPKQAQPATQQKPAAPAKKSPITLGSTNRAAKITGWLAAGVVAGVVIAWGATSLVHRGTTATTAGALQNATSTNSVATSTLLSVVSPQKAGLSVAVSGVTVSEPTWVVVYESRSGKPGNVLGASLFFPGGSSGKVELLRATVAGQSYFVTERKDNGDHRFSLSADSLVMIDGQPSWASFTAN
jgi:hypothetical protein